jgi:hypothetical protein
MNPKEQLQLQIENLNLKLEVLTLRSQLADLAKGEIMEEGQKLVGELNAIIAAEKAAAEADMAKPQSTEVADAAPPAVPQE